METTTKTRIKDLVTFIKTFDSEFNRKQGEDYVYPTSRDMFSWSILASGIEGTVYKASFKNHVLFPRTLAVKEIKLSTVQQTKKVSKKFITMTTNNLYKLFYSTDPFNKPCFTELISQTLVNQLILQKICPNFSFNYYWEHENNLIRTYNEFVNAGDFHLWAQQEHTYHEWCNALFQIMVGLVSIKRYFNMLHTDFHTKNILVYNVKKGGYWTYVINGFKYYLPNLGYQFLIHDFGFAWVPKKLTIDWHYSSTLHHLTKSGEHFYDISFFLREALTNTEFAVPNKVKTFINASFLPEEVNYIFAKTYYKLNANPTDASKYPNIKKTYNGLGTTLTDKLYQMFYTENGYNLSRRIKGQRIESYSLDKSFNKEKIPYNFRHFVTN